MSITVVLAVALVSLVQGEDCVPAADSVSSAVVDSIIAQAISYLGVPYVYGGTDENGFDCSGLAYRVFNDNGIELPRTVTAIGEMGVAVSRDSLQPGDLLIFHNPTHTGIYIGDGEFIHCSSWQDRGVVITEITQSNYARRYFAATRVVSE
ncbi:MAG: C40 family peptidase [Candidatus Fermentibacteraceae bacterium]|nr:C40 family peptidase [Candidatus Fermentibacteraceae bacterium]